MTQILAIAFRSSARDQSTGTERIQGHITRRRIAENTVSSRDFALHDQPRPDIIVGSKIDIEISLDKRGHPGGQDLTLTPLRTKTFEPIEAEKINSNNPPKRQGSFNHDA